MRITAEMKTETRSVLAGAYKGKRVSLKAMLTHLALEDGDDKGLCGKAPNLADRYAMTDRELVSRPTCPRCAAMWDELQALRAAAAPAAERARLVERARYLGRQMASFETMSNSDYEALRRERNQVNEKIDAIDATKAGS